MEKIELDPNRQKTFEWFKGFSNSTYSVNSRLDVTKLVIFSKKESKSFFINMLYAVVNGLSAVPEMRMRLVDGEPVIYEKVNPAFTVMTKTGTFENVRFEYVQKQEDFYRIAYGKIEAAKNQTKINDDEYNPENYYGEYYITCLPWISFTQMTHPIPDDQASQCVPRVCWDKFVREGEKYYLNLNITVSHIFVDGFPLSQAFIEIQKLIDNFGE